MLACLSKPSVALLLDVLRNVLSWTDFQFPSLSRRRARTQPSTGLGLV